MSAAATGICERTVHVFRGGYEVSDDDGVVLATLLGSCVAACLWDPVTRVGGMNHFLLPGATGGADESLSHGGFAMELLINELMKLGAARNRLKAKLFGGAKVINSTYDVGEENAAFAHNYLREEGIETAAESLGGLRGRRIKFWPTSGQARQLFMAANEIAALEPPPAPAPRPEPAGGDVELF